MSRQVSKSWILCCAWPVSTAFPVQFQVSIGAEGSGEARHKHVRERACFCEKSHSPLWFDHGVDPALLAVHVFLWMPDRFSWTLTRHQSYMLPEDFYLILDSRKTPSRSHSGLTTTFPCFYCNLDKFIYGVLLCLFHWIDCLFPFLCLFLSKIQEHVSSATPPNQTSHIFCADVLTRKYFNNRVRLFPLPCYMYLIGTTAIWLKIPLTGLF